MDGYRAAILPTKIGRSTAKLLKLTLDPAVLAKDLAPIFEENPGLAPAILKWDTLQGKLKEWMEEMAVKNGGSGANTGGGSGGSSGGSSTGSTKFDPLEMSGYVNESALLIRSLNLLGKHAVRNLVASYEVLRILDQLPKKPREKLRLNPKDLIPYALSAEEKSETAPGILPELAFLAGFHFDLLKAAFQRAKLNREGILHLERDWGEWLKDAQFSAKLGAQLKKFEDGGLVYAGTLLSRTGEVIQRTLHPSDDGEKSYREFLKNDVREDLTDVRRLLSEKKKFPTLEREWSMMMVREVGLFPEVEAVVRYVEEPWFFHDGRTLVLSDVVFEAISNRKGDRSRRRMALSEEVFSGIRKKST